MEQPSARFLLVEDDDSHAELIELALEENRVVVHVDRVANGDDALAFLRRQGSFADAARPDVILLDLHLPKLDGHEVLATIKNDPDLATIPVVVLTTSEAPADRNQAYTLGVNSYVTKPMDFDKFRAMVHDLQLYWAVWNR